MAAQTSPPGRETGTQNPLKAPMLDSLLAYMSLVDCRDLAGRCILLPEVMMEFLRRLLGSTPRRSFFLYPLVVVGFEGLRQGRLTVPRPVFLPLLLWGYLQYRLTGDYRQRLKAGSRGMERPPDRLLQSGPFAVTRNPMYLGHLIFLLGLALSFRSWLGLCILVANVPWFHARVLEDEARLRARFGAEYEAYAARVRRWLPGLL